ncbi:hypothetical protein AQUSIP_16960 [Aquicella siphonis]|uniref:Secreted protein n=1 Tax=Aquicella siphonis TaxID=254247 RepID=A0A5E4PHJ4_9COXI|nr:hypothetical protein [Aquicella siphonis]VVC76384.1 hypothetical protein AQUSIP_16960 [Aquicella siphonis]
MTVKKMQNKLIPALIVSAFVLSAGVSSSAHAEYYLVYPGSELYVTCNYGCFQPCYQACYQTPVHYFHSVAPKRHYEKGSGEMAEYSWISAP